MWLRLLMLGLLLYTVTQGAQFLSLVYLPAMTTDLLLIFTTILVALLGIWFLRGQPTAMQWGGWPLPGWCARLLLPAGTAQQTSYRHCRRAGQRPILDPGPGRESQRSA